MKKLNYLLILFMVGLFTAACASTANPAEPAATTAVPPAIVTPTLVAATGGATIASPTAVPTLAPSTNTPTEPTAVPNANALLNLVEAELPPNAYDAIDVLPLHVPEGERPLWAVFSQGHRNYDLNPVPGHFVAIYTLVNGRWQALARQTLNNEELGEYGFGPDILFEQGVTQVDLDPTNIWLVVDGGAGAHGGTFQLLRFDGAALHLEKDSGNSSPGVGYLEDLNGDGTPELILRQHDYYVFCYACGVRYLNFEVYSWDATNQRLQEHSIQPMLMGQQGHPAYSPTNRAVELANADLWADAQMKIEEAEQAAARSAEPTDTFTLAWNAALIRFHNLAWQAELNHAPYPLLTNIFYGDYATALDLMRAYSNEQLFSATPPIIQGTMAEGNEQWLAEYILQQTNAAIATQPNLAAAYYFHSWARYLVNPADPQIALDLEQAAALAPNEPLFAQAVQPTSARIQFNAGATAALVTGQLQPQEIDVYVLAAQAGQQMSVMLNSPDENARVTVRDGQGDFLNGQVNTTFWQGELPQTDDYVIRVFAGETAVSYTLQVIIPSHITFAPGAISATINGDVAAYESDDYILAAQAGQTMDVTITSPNNNVLLTIVGADGIPLTNGLMSGAMSWRGELPATQDYTIRAIGTDEATTYTLNVTIE